MSMQASPPPLAPAERRAGPVARLPRRGLPPPGHLRWTFWAVSGGLFLYVLAGGIGESPEVILGAMMIIAAALLPTYLWVTQKITGLPIFPLYALTSICIYGLPLVSDHPIVVLFPPSAQLTAALSLTGFHLLGTLVWYLVVRRPSKPATTCWMFDEQNKDPLFIAALAATTLATVSMSAGWIDPGSSVFSIARAVVFATEGLVCFVLSYRLGQRLLSFPVKLVFFALLGTTLVADLTSLLLISVMSLLGLSMVAYTVAARKLPWRLGAASLLVFAFLHVGKGAMRERYWQDSESVVISPLHYPSLLAEWAATSWRILRNGGDDDEQTESLAQRASLMHLLLYFQYMTPANLPFLYGESYKAVPVQFVPRLFYPDKPRSHEGTYILCIHYGLQTQEDTYVTTIDIGLINEAYANFGFVGMAALAVVLGGCFGAASRWARHMPIFSFRTLFAVTVLASILQASSSASFYVASLYQNIMVLFGLALLVMRPKRINRSAAIA